MEIKLKVCFFKPESELNEKDNELYKQNIITVTSQFAFSEKTLVYFAVDHFNEGDVLDNLIAQGKYSNQTFITFTATPKNKTIEAFENQFTDAKTENTVTRPFHVYLMRQTIEKNLSLMCSRLFNIYRSFQDY